MATAWLSEVNKPSNKISHLKIETKTKYSRVTPRWKWSWPFSMQKIWLPICDDMNGPAVPALRIFAEICSKWVELAQQWQLMVNNNNNGEQQQQQQQTRLSIVTSCASYWWSWPRLGWAGTAWRRAARLVGCLTRKNLNYIFFREAGVIFSCLVGCLTRKKPQLYIFLEKLVLYSHVWSVTWEEKMLMFRSFGGENVNFCLNCKSCWASFDEKFQYCSILTKI